MVDVTGAGVWLAPLALALAAGLFALRRHRDEARIPSELAAVCDAILRIDADGALESIDPGRNESPPWPSDAARWQDLIHVEDHARVEEALGNAARRSVTPLRLRSQDGSWHRGLVLWRPARGGRLDGYFRVHEPGPPEPAPSPSLAPFVSAVTHQLNNRLHLIRGFVEVAQQRGDLSEEAIQQVTRIDEVVDESAELLRRLSMLASDSHPAPQRLDVAEALTRIVDFAAPVLGGRTTLQFLPPDEALTLSAPPLPLLQAGTALLLLAAVKQGRSGEIRIVVGRLGEAEIAIDILGQATLPQDADAESDSLLALALERLDVSGGRLELESDEDSQRMRVVLPSERAARLDLPAMDAGEGRHVLVVDASAHERSTLCEILEEEGFRSWEAANGHEAAVIAASLGPLALLIVDALLDKETGVEVRDRVAAIQPGARVLFTTSFPGVLGVNDGHADAPPALAKPFKREELIRRVRDVLSD